MRKRFSLNAVASSDGAPTRVMHDKRANTTGRTPYKFCGKEVIVTAGKVFLKSTGKMLGFFTINKGHKYVTGYDICGILTKTT
jgi:hypothetical protein